MSKRVKTTKFKVINAKINKKLVGDEFDLQKIKPKGGHDDGERKPENKNRMTLDKLAKIVTNGFAEQTKFNKQQIEFNTRIEKEVSNLRHDVSSLSTRIDNLVKVNNLKE